MVVLKEIPAEKYKTNSYICYLVLYGIFLYIFFGMFHYAYFIRKYRIYSFDVLNSIFWILLCMIWITRIIIWIFIRKRAIRYYKSFKTKNHTPDNLHATFCMMCGKEIDLKVFKMKNNKIFIKPTRLMSIKGYCCKSCYKKYQKYTLIEYLVEGFFWFIILYPIYFKYKSLMEPNIIIFLGIIFIIFFIGFLIITFLTFYLPYRKYT